jgi:hypothetical protein
MDPIETEVFVGNVYGKMVAPNLTFMNTRFYGRPNFSGTPNDFNDARPQCTVLIQAHHLEELQRLGYNVKPSKVNPDFPDNEPFAHLRVMVDQMLFEERDGQQVQVQGPEITIKMGDQLERLNNATMAILDKSRIVDLDVEVRAWDYPKREPHEPYSARLVKLVATIERDRLSEKHGLGV